ncbi:MAG: tetratricopeptide repeat protein [Bacteroidales bacterium]|nr:tetratricopeptide repeat protein [Bacteroidales bacterium]
MRLIFFLIILLFICDYISAQTSTIDSLIDLGKSLKNEEKINNLISISRAYFLLGDTMSRRYSSEACVLSKEAGYEEGIGKASLFLGISYNEKAKNNAETDSALKYFKISSDILSGIKHPWAGFGYENGGAIYRNRGWYPEAIDFLFKALKVYQMNNDSLQSSKTISSIGYSYDRIKNHEEAISWQRKAIMMFPKSGDILVKGLAFGRIGISYDEMGIYDSAHFYNKKALDIFVEAKDHFYITQWLSNIGNTYIKQGNYFQAEKYLNRSIHLNIKDIDKSTKFNNLGKVYLETGRYQEAEVILDSAIYLAGKFDRIEALSEAYFRKYELNLALKKPDKALDFFVKYSSIKDSIQNEEKIKQTAYMKIRYETEQKENELLREKAENEKLAKEKALITISVFNRNKWIIGISSLSLIIIFFLLFISQRIKRKIQSEKDAAVIKEKEMGLNAVITAQEEERKRIAKDLHDGIVQQLGGVIIGWRLLLENSKEDKKSEKVLLNTLEDSSDELREISHRMMPKALAELGVIAAIDDLLQSNLEHLGIIYEFEHFGIDERIQENIEICIYRVTQELVNNIIKHSKADLVNIQLYKTGNMLVMTVEDNGIGFPLDHKKDGIGLINITTRLDAVNGSVHFGPGIEKGTLISLKIPLT